MNPNFDSDAPPRAISISHLDVPQPITSSTHGDVRDTLSDVHVSSILRPPVIVTRDLPLTELAVLLSEQSLENSQALVIVIDEHNEAVGLVNAAQVMRLGGTYSRDSLLDLCAEDSVVEACLVVPLDATLQWVARLLTEAGEAAAVVVDPFGKPLGTVSALELLGGLGFQS